MLDRIGRYQVESRLGSGAFATVWLAVDESLDARLAIKVLAENWMHDADVRRRFSEEARILWRLDSDRIIRVHAVDELPDGRPYFVMDYADGGNLADRMGDRAKSGPPFEIAEAVAISVAIAEGLAVAHGQGIVHRDLKPSNVMFRRTNTGGERIVLADFGIARSLEAAGATTISAGTPHYMAPEQADGRADRGSDVYAAAVVLYELLAGSVPYPFPSAGQVMRAQMTGPAPDVRLLRPEVPAQLAAALATGLQNDPAHRYPTAEAWRDAIQAGASAAGGVPWVPPVSAPTPPPDAGVTMGPAELAQARATAPPTTPWPAPTPGPPGAPPPSYPPPTGGGAPYGGPPPPRKKRRRKGALFGVLALFVLVGLVSVIAVASGGKASADELYRDPASNAGIGPFMGSLVPASLTAPGATTPSLPPLTLPDVSLPPGLPATIPTVPTVPSSVPGSTPGLYGGTRLLSVCDAKAMVEFLTANPDKAAAWAGALGITVAEIAGYTAGLTDVILRSDTRVTNHSFVNGVAQAKQAILEAGTAVLVDAFGIPRVRCFCGNPLLPPKPVKSRIKYTGPSWPTFSPTNITVIVQGPRIDNLVLVDVRDAKPFARPAGTSGAADVDAPNTSTPPGTTASTATTAPATSVTTAPTTTSPPTTVAPPKTPVNIAKEGTVSVSSTFGAEFPARLSVDGSESTSWFSKGASDGTSTFTWRASKDNVISRVEIVGNAKHARGSAFQRGQGFRSSKLEIFDASGAVVSTFSFTGPGDSANRLTATPNVVGRSIRISLSGHENPECGGFSELNVITSR